MKSNPRLYIFLSFILLGALAPLGFQNCVKMEGSQVSESASIDYGNGFNRPAQVCGKEGFRYLRDRYFRFHCAHCHDGSIQFAPEKTFLFGVADLEYSYQEMLKVPAAVVIETTTNNSFCGTNCNLKDGNPVFNDLKYWLQHPTVCP